MLIRSNGAFHYGSISATHEDAEKKCDYIGFHKCISSDFLILKFVYKFLFYVDIFSATVKPYLRGIDRMREASEAAR
jgi:hypothetical protein